MTKLYNVILARPAPRRRACGRQGFAVYEQVAVATGFISGSKGVCL